MSLLVRIIGFSFWLQFLSAQVMAEIVVSATMIEGIFEPAGTGKYDAIIEKTQSNEHLITIRHHSAVEARRVFKLKETDCFSPSDQQVELFAFPVVQSNTLNVAKAYVFWRVGERAMPAVSDLETQVVGYRIELQTASSKKFISG